MNIHSLICAVWEKNFTQPLLDCNRLWTRAMQRFDKKLNWRYCSKVPFMVKFIYSEKATKFFEIFPLLLTAVHTVKSKGKISQNFVAFLEYMNFSYTGGWNAKRHNRRSLYWASSIFIAANFCESGDDFNHFHWLESTFSPILKFGVCRGHWERG